MRRVMFPSTEGIRFPGRRFLRRLRAKAFANKTDFTMRTARIECIETS